MAYAATFNWKRVPPVVTDGRRR